MEKPKSELKHVKVDSKKLATKKGAYLNRRHDYKVEGSKSAEHDMVQEGKKSTPYQY